uniref:Variable surface glycoprotein 2 n=1 Tax=Trypanosoma equiperdum TaxID=5694 RepID=A0A0M5IL50_TRYEQ|nr:variable surface glycoprotein 2 [Trypanosoma equiperdum]
MHKSRIFLAIAVLSLAASRPAEPAAHNAFKWDEVKHLCSFAVFLKKVPAAVRHKAAEAQRAIEAAAEARTQATMAAYKAPGRNESIVYAATAAAADNCISANLYSKGLTATAKAAQTTGHIEEFINLLKVAGAGGDSTGYCLQTAASDAPTADTTLDGDECTQLDFDDKAAQLTFEGDHMTATGFKQLSTKSLLGSQASKCALLAKNADDTVAATDLFQKKKEQKLLQGLLKVSAKHDGASTATLESLNTAAADWAIKQPTTQLHKLYNALAEAKATIEKQTYCGTDAKSVILHVVGAGKTGEEIEKYLKAIYPADKKNTAKTDAQAMIDKVAGTADNQKAKIQEQIVNTGATKIQGTTAESKQLKDISGNEQLQAAFIAQRVELFDASSSAAKACQSQKTQTTKITETDATCEKKGKENNCKDGCKWNSEGENKTCVVDPNYKPKQAEGGEKSENDGKTTNTTGSNSFVINKAPLLLAVLFF